MRNTVKVDVAAKMVRKTYHSKSAAQVEWFVLRGLDESGFTPRLLQKMLQSRDLTLHIELIQGITLRTLCGEAPHRASLAFKGLGKLLAQLHERTSKWRSALPGYLLHRTHAHAMALAYRVLPSSSIARAEILFHIMKQPTSVLDCLLHRDVSLDNVLVTPENVCYLLDFENACFGHPYGDVWRFLEIECEGVPAQLREDFQEGYGFDNMIWELWKPVMSGLFFLEVVQFASHNVGAVSASFARRLDEIGKQIFGESVEFQAGCKQYARTMAV